SLSDMDALLACFTEDAVLDLGGINLPRFAGHEEIRGFFREVFSHMTHHAHYATNLRVDRIEGDSASCRAYVIGMGNADDGRSILVYVRYFLDFRRTNAGWKLYHFSENALMPLPPEVSEVHTREQA